jgi:hypothetical protein
MDNIWFTCCALHNMLLEIDGLHRRWANGVPSDYEGPLGLHDSIGDVRNGLDAEVFARVRDPINYDTSSGVRNAIYHNASTSTSITSISMKDMRELLVDHFMYLWLKKQVKWPSRTGIVEYRKR